ncbi:MAG: hypothetical protein QCH35_08625 [Methanomicrobiaceae archaeon]|nr:hypothetical protein [Methanomicrobiaceae archaeon]
MAFDPAALAAVRVTGWAPSPVNRCTGFCSSGVSPSPKSHASSSISPVEPSKNWMEAGAPPKVLFFGKEATGDSSSDASGREASSGAEGRSFSLEQMGLRA